MFKGVWKLNLISSTPNRDGIHTTTGIMSGFQLPKGGGGRLRVQRKRENTPLPLNMHYYTTATADQYWQR